MYCTCNGGGKIGYTAMPEASGFNYDHWVCSKCLMPSKMSFEKVTNKVTPYNAIAFLNLHGLTDGTHLLTWKLKDGSHIKTMNYVPYPRKNDMPNGRNHLLRFWQDLDGLIDEIRDDSGIVNVHIEERKVQARTYAEVLAQLMHPFYEDSNAVLKEAMNRWTANKEGELDHQTPGLAESIWDPATRFDGTPYSKEAETKARAKVATPAVVLDEQKVTFIKTMLANGTMTAEVLSGMFGVTVAQIAEVTA